jgi:hypothetical protein
MLFASCKAQYYPIISCSGTMAQNVFGCPISSEQLSMIYSETTLKAALLFSTYSFLGAFAKLWHPPIRFVMPVCRSAWNNSAPNKGMLIKFDTWTLQKSVWEIQVLLNSHKNNGYFTRRPNAFMIISPWILLRIRNVSDKSCRISNLIIFFSENGTFYEILWKMW